MFRRSRRLPRIRITFGSLFSAVTKYHCSHLRLMFSRRNISRGRPCSVADPFATCEEKQGFLRCRGQRGQSSLFRMRSLGYSAHSLAARVHGCRLFLSASASCDGARRAIAYCAISATIDFLGGARHFRVDDLAKSSLFRGSFPLSRDLLSNIPSISRGSLCGAGVYCTSRLWLY